MDSTALAPDLLVPSQSSELSSDLGAARPGLDAIERASGAQPRASFGRRASRRACRFLLVFCTGAGVTLAWQAYGDSVRDLIAASWPQLGWLAPAAETPAQSTQALQASTAASPAPSEVQQLAGAIDAMRQSVAQLTTQVAAGQGKVVDDMAKLRSEQQELARKVATAVARIAAAPVRKPAPVAPAASASLPAPAPAPASTSGQTR